jgi:hypothetical protein
VQSITTVNTFSVIAAPQQVTTSIFTVPPKGVASRGAANRGQQPLS